MDSNLYSILGVSLESNKNEIDAAYRKLAIRWHPDKNKNNQDATEKFREISKAYQILSNDESRRNYDLYGTKSNVGNVIDPYSIFKDAFNTEENTIPNVIVKLEAGIDKLYTGFTDTIEIDRFSQCHKCESTGTYNKLNGDCQTCKGRGILMETITGGKMGYMFNEKKCDICEGSGIDPEIKKCKKCRGHKYIKERIECEIDVPAGAYDQYYIKLENEGNFIPVDERKDDPNKVRTDIIVVIKEIIPKELNIRRGMYIRELRYFNNADILMEVTIDFSTSIIGVQKSLKYLSDTFVNIKIDGVIQNGDIHVVPKMGMPIVPEEISKYNNKKGDLFILFRVNKPNLTNKQSKRIWQILTGTSYPEFDDIDETLHFIPSKCLDMYIEEHKKNNC